MTATITTIPTLSVETAELEKVTVPMYRNIHKGIRAELFGVTAAAGSVDPGEAEAVAAVGERWRTLVRILVSHAEHEDEFVQPLVEFHAPELAEVIAVDHPRLESQMAALELLTDRAVASCPAERRLLVERVYLGLASFTAEFVQHMEFEEFRVMPLLSEKETPERLWAVDHALVASIPPDEMAAALPLMLAAMNIDNRVEALGGMRATAPAQVFEGVYGLAASVLEPANFAALGARLGITPAG